MSELQEATNVADVQDFLSVMRDWDSERGKILEYRKQLIQKLGTAVDTMIIDPNNGSAKTIEAQMGVANSFNSALDSFDKSFVQRGNLSLKQLQLEADIDNSKRVVELLKRVQCSTIAPTEEDYNQSITDLESTIDATDIEINEGELRLDSDNLS